MGSPLGKMIAALEEHQNGLAVVIQDSDYQSLRSFMRGKITENFGGWRYGDIEGQVYRVPKKPKMLYEQFSLEIKRRLEPLLESPQFQIRDKWFCVKNPDFFGSRIWEMNIHDRILYAKFRIKNDKLARECSVCFLF